MKLLDIKEGRFIGINVVDLVVLVVVLFLFFSFGTKILAKDLTFSGEEMYNAIQTYQRLDSKGFLVEAEAKGKWIAGGTEAYARGIIIETRSGAFALKSKSGKVWVGGSMAYLEDIAVSELTFIPTDAYVASFDLEARTFSSYRDFLGYFNTLARELRAEHLRIGGSTVMPADISFTNPKKSAQEIFNELNQLHYLKYVGIAQMGSNEVIIRLRVAELFELEKINIEAEKVTISEAKVYAGYSEMPLHLDSSVYHVASLEDLK
ncbi:MAG: hypothetical protein HY930_00120 [Euryarchaeota archaeon]|nr:hypothetical protein [Euryarchaeota archaeon]